MRVAIVAESFLPNINGVTNSVLRVLEHLRLRGHQALVIAPGAREYQEEVPEYLGFPIVRVPTVRVPLIDSLPVGVPTTTVHAALADFAPDVVHLASPFVLGAAGAFAARQLHVPAVALYQTDVAGFAAKYHLPTLASLAWDWTRTIHNSCQLTLAPSSAAIKQLEEHGIRRVQKWGRGVDAQLFHPLRRSDVLRRSWDPAGQKQIVGYVGRLAAEKSVHRLVALRDVPGLQLVIVGDGPERAALEQALPTAVFTGALSGTELARAYASMDVFVHTGEFETFCQTIQEAQASGVPAVAPRAGGPIDLIDDYVTGRLVGVEKEGEFEAALPEAVLWVLDAQRHDALRNVSRATVAQRSWEAQCEQLVGYYEQARRGYRARGLRLPMWARRVKRYGQGRSGEEAL